MAVYSYGYEDSSTALRGAEIVKSFYDDGIREAHYNATPLLNRLKRVTPTESVGNDFVISVEFGFDGGFSAVREGGAMAHPAAVSRDKATVPVLEVSQVIALTHRQIAVAKGNKASFVNALTNKVAGASKAFNFHSDRMCWLDGTGYLANVSSAGSTSTAAGTYGYAIYVAANSDLRHLFDGMLIDIIDGDFSTNNVDAAYHARVSQITRSATAPYFVAVPENDSTWVATPNSSDHVMSAGPWTSATGRKYTGAKVSGSSSDNDYLEFTGFEAIIDSEDPCTGDFQGIDRGLYTQWGANVETASANRPLSEKLMIGAAQAAQSRGGSPSAIYCDYTQLANYGEIKTADVRHYDIASITGGFQGLLFAFGDRPIPIFGCYQCKPNCMYFVDESHIFFVETAPMEWIPGTAGAGVMHWDVGTSQVIGALEWFGNMACDNPGSCTLLEALE